jgi:asparagine N-glycosylation enzyme membrane subunit Stt3
LDKCKEWWDEIDVGQFFFFWVWDGWELGMKFLLLEHGSSMQFLLKTNFFLWVSAFNLLVWSKKKKKKKELLVLAFLPPSLVPW